MNQKIKELARYVFPAVGALCVTFLYNIVDGIFVGRGIGKIALGAVNISVPFVTLTVAIAAMFPMGGATVIANRMGSEDKEGANQAFMLSLVMTIIVSLLLTIIGTVFSKEIVMFCGGDNLSLEMSEMAVQYLFYYMLFCFPMLMAPCLSAFVRNDGAPGIAFVGMCVGAASNILLDWFFVFFLKSGVVGAAIASGLGQLTSCAVLLSHFIFKKGELRIQKFNVDFPLIWTICKCGIPETASQLATPVISYCYNIVLSSLIGDLGISTFSVLSFIFSLANAILMGVAQGMQPLWSRDYSKNDKLSLHYNYKAALIINITVAVVIVLLLDIFPSQVVSIFNNEPDLIASGVKAMPVFVASFIPMAVNLVIAGYFFSIQKTLQANLISVSRGIVLKALAIFIVPMMFGKTNVWLSPLVAESATLIIAIIVVIFDKKKIYKD